MKLRTSLAKTLALVAVGGAMLIPMTASAAPQNNRGDHGRVEKEYRPIEREHNDLRKIVDYRKDRFEHRDNRSWEFKTRERSNDRCR